MAFWIQNDCKCISCLWLQGWLGTETCGSYSMSWERIIPHITSLLLCSLTKLYWTLCNPMDCSTPGSPVLHSIRAFAQIHVHWVRDDILSSHLLPLSSPLALNLSQHQGLSYEMALHIRWPKHWHFSFSISLSKE